MRVFDGFSHLEGLHRPVITIGSFDGVHLGHREILRRLRQTALSISGESTVITFDPHPRQFLGSPVGILSTREEKAELLSEEMTDNLIVAPFDAALCGMSADEFVRTVLLDKVGACGAVLGADHRFGHDGIPGCEAIAAATGGDSFPLISVNLIGDMKEKVSSTRIRRMIGEGCMEDAARLLSGPYLLIADALGNALIINEGSKLLPPEGEYDVTVNGVPERLHIEADACVRTDHVHNGTVKVRFLRRI